MNPLRKIGLGLAIGLSLTLLLWMRAVVQWRPRVIGLQKPLGGKIFVYQIDEVWTGKTSIQFSPDGRLLVLSQGKSRKAHTWDVQQGRSLFQIPNYSYQTVIFSPDSSQLLVYGFSDIKRNYACSLLSARDGKLLREIRVPPLADTDDLLQQYTFSPDGKEVWACTRQEIRRMDARTGRYLGPRRYNSIQGQFVRGYQFSPNGKQVLVNSGLEQRLYDSTSARLLRVFKNQSRFLKGGWSPDGSVLWLGGDTANDNLQLRRVRDGQLLGSFPLTKLKSTIHFLPDGKTLAVATNKGLELHDIATGQIVKTLPGPLSEPFDISPDGSFAVSIDEKSGQLWRWRLK